MNETQLPKVMVCHPIYGANVTQNFYRGMLSLARTYRGEIDFQIASGFSAQWSRELLAEKFLKSDYEYLLFVDSDIGVPMGSLEKLLSHKKAIVSGLSFGKVAPFPPHMYTLIDEEKGYAPIIQYPEGLIEVDACGTDCLLIHREVFEKLPKPWFQHPRIDYTDDIYFCRLAKEAGYKVYVDTTIKTLHDANMSVSESLFKANIR